MRGAPEDSRQIELAPHTKTERLSSLNGLNYLELADKWRPDRPWQPIRLKGNSPKGDEGNEQ